MESDIALFFTEKYLRAPRALTPSDRPAAIADSETLMQLHKPVYD